MYLIFRFGIKVKISFRVRVSFMFKLFVRAGNRFGFSVGFYCYILVLS